MHEVIFILPVTPSLFDFPILSGGLSNISYLDGIFSWSALSDTSFGPGPFFKNFSEKFA